MVKKWLHIGSHAFTMIAKFTPNHHQPFVEKLNQKLPMKTQDKIRAIRTQQKISQEQMAERLELTPQAYSKIESGKTKLNLDRIQQIAHILNIDVTELIHNNDNGVFLLINENCTNKNGLNHGAIIYHANQQLTNEKELIHENDKLQLIITHKDEIIAQLQNENALLKQMLDLLKSNQSQWFIDKIKNVALTTFLFTQTHPNT